MRDDGVLKNVNPGVAPLSEYKFIAKEATKPLIIEKKGLDVMNDSLLNKVIRFHCVYLKFIRVLHSQMLKEIDLRLED